MGRFGPDITLPSRDFEARLRRWLMGTETRITDDHHLRIARHRRVDVKTPGDVILQQAETIIPGGVMLSVQPVCRQAYTHVLACALAWGTPIASYHDTQGPGGADYEDLTCLWHESGDSELAVGHFLDHMHHGYDASRALTLEDLIHQSRGLLYPRSP